ncbi:MAG: hypothetical protein ACM3ZE_31615 [Myxococcales bacterium]
MNALVVLWKLRSDLQAILAAAAPQQEKCSSESRLVTESKINRHRQGSPVTKLIPQTELDGFVLADDSGASDPDVARG